jgi:hypothetical protein
MFTVQRIPGTKMGLADYLSRMYNGEDPDKYLTTNEQFEQLVGLMLLETIMTTQLGENVENDFIDEFQYFENASKLFKAKLIYYLKWNLNIIVKNVNINASIYQNGVNI